MAESADKAIRRDEPWLMRTYSGHSTAKASNELYRTNLAKGQTGLSIAFDLPTQTGYDPDSLMATGEVGKVGVPVSHLGHMRTLLDGIPPGQMNTSMTINAPAAWMLALYVANAEEQGIARGALRGTTQNDILKEYLSRGTYIFPPVPSRRLIVDMVAWCANNAPKWNPMNVCSYHLQEVGATPVQEIAFSLANAVGILDAVRDSGQVPPEQFSQVFGSISFFVNAGIRFIEEICKMRAFTELWDRIGLERYGVTDEKARRFRYGVQVNSLGLTEAQPENNIQRIVLEMLAVSLSKNARARSIQLPAWNEALGLPRPWDQQWSLRMQQVLAFETDLLEYADIFDGSTVIEKKTADLRDAAWAEYEEILAMGGAFESVDTLKGRLVKSMAERTRRIESGEQIVVGGGPAKGMDKRRQCDRAVDAAASDHDVGAGIERRGDREGAGDGRGAGLPVRAENPSRRRPGGGGVPGRAGLCLAPACPRCGTIIMADLLIELFSEEIPARMQARAREDLKSLLTNGLVEAGLTYASAGAFSTPRRLVLSIEGLSAESRAVREERKGPRTDAPAAALDGFLRSTGLTKDQLEIRDDKKAQVYFAVLEKPGRRAPEIIAEVLEATIRTFPWPKSMRWGPNLTNKNGDLRWVRPISRILCTFDGEVVPFEIEGMEALAEYLTKLRERKVGNIQKTKPMLVATGVTGRPRSRDR